VGGESWIVGSYDPDLDLTYWGVAQAKAVDARQPNTTISTTCSTPVRP
jgi:hypothetical protein